MKSHKINLIIELMNITGIIQKDIADAFKKDKSNVSRWLNDKYTDSQGRHIHDMRQDQIINYLFSEIAKGNLRNDITEGEKWAVLFKLYLNTGYVIFNHCTGISNVMTKIHKKREPNTAPSMHDKNLNLLSVLSFWAFDFVRTLDAQGKTVIGAPDETVLDMFYNFTREKSIKLGIIKNPAEAGHVRDN